MKNVCLKFFLFTFVYFAGLHSYSFATEDNSYKLDQIVVTSTRVERLLKDLPISVTAITDKDIQRKPTGNIADQLANVPGVMVHNQSAGNKRVNIRGMSGSRILILIDGVRQPELRSGDGAPISIDPSQVERIEVIKGPASVLYGSDAIGGVLNIITKKAGEKKLSFSQNFIFDSSNNSFEPQTSIYGKYNGFSYRFSGSGLNAGDVRVPEGVNNGKLENTSFKKRNYSGLLGYQWDGGSLSFEASQFDILNMGHILRFKDPLQGGKLVAATPDQARAETGENPKIGRLTYQCNLVLNELSENLAKLSLKVYDQKLTRESRNYAYKSDRKYTQGITYQWTDNIQDSFGGSLQTDWRFGDSHYLIAGIDYDKTDFKSTQHDYNGKTGAHKSSYYKKGQQDVVGLFLQDEWQLAENWKSTLGLRNTWIKTELEKDTYRPKYSSGSTKDNKLVSSLGLVYSGIENMELRALFSQGYRNPNLLQLFMGSSNWMLPNPDLKPESSNNYELGLRYSGYEQRLNLDAALFYSDLKDAIVSQKIGTDPKSGDSLNQYRNMEKVRTYGAEISVDYTVESLNLTPYINGTWMRYIATDKDNFKAGHSKGRPTVWGTLGMKWEAQLNEDYRFFSDLNMLSTSKSYQSKPDGSKDDYKKGWSTLNLALGFEGASEGQYHVSLNLNNIMNKQYELPLSTLYVEPGFNVVLGVGVKF